MREGETRGGKRRGLDRQQHRSSVPISASGGDVVKLGRFVNGAGQGREREASVIQVRLPASHLVGFGYGIRDGNWHSPPTNGNLHLGRVYPGM